MIQAGGVGRGSNNSQGEELPGRPRFAINRDGRYRTATADRRNAAPRRTAVPRRGGTVSHFETTDEYVTGQPELTILETFDRGVRL